MCVVLEKGEGLGVGAGGPVLGHQKKGNICFCTYVCSRPGHCDREFVSGLNKQLKAAGNFCLGHQMERRRGKQQSASSPWRHHTVEFTHCSDFKCLDSSITSPPRFIPPASLQTKHTDMVYLNKCLLLRIGLIS